MMSFLNSLLQRLTTMLAENGTDDEPSWGDQADSHAMPPEALVPMGIWMF